MLMHPQLPLGAPLLCNHACPPDVLESKTCAQCASCMQATPHEVAILYEKTKIGYVALVCALALMHFLAWFSFPGTRRRQQGTTGAQPPFILLTFTSTTQVMEVLPAGLALFWGACSVPHAT